MAQPSQTGRALLEGETVATEDDFQEARDDVTQTDVAAEEVRDHPVDPRLTLHTIFLCTHNRSLLI